MSEIKLVSPSENLGREKSQAKGEAESKVRRGAIVLNLGTPQAPQVKEVRDYLREFLMDPYVIDVPLPIRWMIVNGAVLPTRPAASAEAYRKIWTDRGSPLLVHLLDLSKNVQSVLGEGWLVQPAMRYGQPSIESAFRNFKESGISEVTVFPLYPQYSLAATETSIQECRKVALQVSSEFKLQFLGAFYRHPAFIQSFVEQARNSLKDFKYDHLLFSFHGLPERHVKKTDLSGDHCLKQDQCCSVIGEANKNCYRAQCFQTAHAIARELELKSNQYTVCFQSRLGRNPWIKPYSDHLYESLPSQGVKRVAVMCPAFVADCLETLEEIEIRGKEEFIRHGGEDLRLVPSLNSGENWSRAVAEFFESQSISSEVVAN